MQVTKLFLSAVFVLMGIFYWVSPFESTNLQIESVSSTMKITKDNINQVGKDGYPPIVKAIMSRDLEAVVRMVELGADVNFQKPGKDSPALRAAQVQTWDICLYLLKKGANPMATNSVGNTISNLAATSRVKIDSEQGEALVKVRDMLEFQGVYKFGYPPKIVKEMVASGNWPPK